MFLKITSAAGAVVLIICLALVAVLVIQGKSKVDMSGQYVSLGSSYATGYGLGPRAPGSPMVCMRSTNGYPPLLAQMTGLRFTQTRQG